MISIPISRWIYELSWSVIIKFRRVWRYSRDNQNP